MNIWNNLILASVLLTNPWISVSSDFVKLDDVPEDSCQDCLSIPDSPNSKLNKFSHFAVVVEMNTTYIAIGTKNAVVFVTRNGTYLYDIPLTTPKDAMDRCKATYTDNPELCFSVVDFIIKQDSKEIACGKIAGQRNCWSISDMISNSIPVGQYYRKEQFAYLNTDPFFYSAFQDTNGKAKLLKHNLAVADDNYVTTYTSTIPTYPKFVSVYEFGNYIYYFYQEKQEEVQSSDKITISRVARQCKYDRGGPANFFYKRVLTLFSKARLLCEKKTDASTMDPPIHYNILKKTTYVVAKDGKVYFYGLFGSSINARLSVICRFSLEKIDEIFETSKYYTKKDSVLVAQTPSPKDPRFSHKCNSSLDTTSISTSTLQIAVRSPLAFQSVKPEGGKPVVMFEDAQVTGITAETVDTSIGLDTYHVLHVLSPKVIYNVAVPRDLGGNIGCNVYSKQIISKDPLEVLDFKKIQNLMFVGSISKVAIVPDVACDIYKTCKQCCQAKNPHCGWHNSNTCQEYNFSRQSEYKQDVGNGDFSKLCDKEQAKCELSFNQLPVPSKEVALICKYDGVPTTSFNTLKKDGVDVNLTLTKFTVKNKRDEIGITIKNYNLADAGTYSCHVNNLWSTATCNVTLPGSLPQLMCRVSKLDSWFLTCNASGYPQPKIYYQVFDETGILSEQVSGNRTKVVANSTYRFYVYNQFGPVIGERYKLFSKSFEFAINKEWSDDYGDITTLSYKTMKSKLVQEVQKLYNEMKISIDNVKFRKGSVVASFQLTSLTTRQSNVEQPIMDAIENGKLGDLGISEYQPTTAATENHQSTNPPFTQMPTTRPPATRKVPSPLLTTSRFTKTNSTTSIAGTPAPDTGDRVSSSNTVPYVVVIAIMVIIIIILAVVVCYMCKVHYYFCKHLRSSRPASESSASEDEEMQNIKRSTKGRESRAKLLHKSDEQDGNSVEKSKKSHSPTIARENKTDEKADQSNC